MKFPLTKEDINFSIIDSDFLELEEDEEFGEGIPSDEIIKKMIYGYKEKGIDYSVNVYYNDEESDNSLGLMNIGIRQYDNRVFDGEFEATLRIVYKEKDDEQSENDKEEYTIYLDEIPKKMYGNIEEYDFGAIIDEGIKMFNRKFEPKRYGDCMEKILFEVLHRLRKKL